MKFICELFLKKCTVFGVYWEAKERGEKGVTSELSVFILFVGIAKRVANDG